MIALTKYKIGNRLILPCEFDSVMLKKMCLTLCLTAFLAWAQDDEFDDSDFVSAGNSAAATGASSESGSGDEFDDAEDSYVSRSKKEDMEARKKFEEDQRADEYANSLRRRDWLKDRLMLEIGMGSRMPFMGETGMGMGFGAGVEYITRWHIGAYASFGFLPKGTDTDFDDIELEGGTGYKVGLNYYLFPKNPLHLGLSVSYGTVYFDHNVKPEDGVRPLIKVNGVQFDALITYLICSSPSVCITLLNLPRKMSRTPAFVGPIRGKKLWNLPWSTKTV